MGVNESSGLSFYANSLQYQQAAGFTDWFLILYTTYLFPCSRISDRDDYSQVKICSGHVDYPSPSGRQIAKRCAETFPTNEQLD